jgi:uncharacterized protein YggU (UPF0235/DUF167 family)
VIADGPEGVSILVRVIPRSGATKIDGVRDGRLLVRLAAAPVDGAANDALIAFFAKFLKIPARNISVAAGLQSRNKRIVLAGIDAGSLKGRLSLG